MAKTEVILTHNIVGLGGESDQVKVAAGYARNYLFPQGLAIPLTGANKRRLEALKQLLEKTKLTANLLAEIGSPTDRIEASAPTLPGERSPAFVRLAWLRLFLAQEHKERRRLCRVPGRRRAGGPSRRRRRLVFR